MYFNITDKWWGTDIQQRKNTNLFNIAYLIQQIHYICYYSNIPVLHVLSYNLTTFPSATLLLLLL